MPRVVDHADRSAQTADMISSFNRELDTYINSDKIEDRVNAFRSAVEIASCCGIQKLKDQITAYAPGFVDSCGAYIMQGAIDTASVTAVADALNKINQVSEPIVAAQLLLAINATVDQHGNVEILTSDSFLNSMKGFNTDVACALLYEVGLTGKVTELTDSRLFTENAVGFFNDLGQESASEWFYSIGKTGNIGDLTSERVLTKEVSEAIKEDSKLATELSYAIGETRRADLLASQDFLGVLKGLDPVIASEYLSAIWCTGKPEELTAAGVIGMITRGEADIWKDIARINGGGGADSPLRVLISQVGNDGHDRGSKLVIKSLIDAGIDVVYTGNIQDPKRIASIAVQMGANAIGFGVESDSYKGVVMDTLKEMKVQGFKDVVMFSGGAITQNTARGFDQKGIKFFAPGTLPKEIVTFLNASAVRQLTASVSSSATVTMAGRKTAGTFSPAGADWLGASISYTGCGPSTTPSPVLGFGQTTSTNGDAVSATQYELQSTASTPKRNALNEDGKLNTLIEYDKLTYEPNTYVKIIEHIKIRNDGNARNVEVITRIETQVKDSYRAASQGTAQVQPPKTREVNMTSGTQLSRPARQTAQANDARPISKPEVAATKSHKGRPSTVGPVRPDTAGRVNVQVNAANTQVLSVTPTVMTTSTGRIGNSTTDKNADSVAQSIQPTLQHFQPTVQHDQPAAQGIQPTAPTVSIMVMETPTVRLKGTAATNTAASNQTPILEIPIGQINRSSHNYVNAIQAAAAPNGDNAVNAVHAPVPASQKVAVSVQRSINLSPANYPSQGPAAQVRIEPLQQTAPAVSYRMPGQANKRIALRFVCRR